MAIVAEYQRNRKMFGNKSQVTAGGGVQGYSPDQNYNVQNQPPVTNAASKSSSTSPKAPARVFRARHRLQLDYRAQQASGMASQSSSSGGSGEPALISFPIDDSQLPKCNSVASADENNDAASSVERTKTRPSRVKWSKKLQIKHEIPHRKDAKKAYLTPDQSAAAYQARVKYVYRPAPVIPKFDLSVVFEVLQPEEWEKVAQQPFWKCLVSYLERFWPEYSGETDSFREAHEIAWEERPIEEAIAYYQALAALPEGSVKDKTLGWFSSDCDYKHGYTTSELLLTKDVQKAKEFVRTMWRFECERRSPIPEKIIDVEDFTFQMWSIGEGMGERVFKNKYQAQARQVQMAFFSQVPRSFLAQYACTIWNKNEAEKSHGHIYKLANRLYLIGNHLLDGDGFPEEQRDHVKYILQRALAYKTMGRRARDTDSPPGLEQMRLVEWIGPEVDPVRERVAIALAHAWHAKHQDPSSADPLELDFSGTALSTPLTDLPPNLHVLAGLGLQKLDLSGHSLNIVDRLHELLHLGAQCTIDLRDNDPVITQKMLNGAIAIAKVKKKNRPTVLIGSSSEGGAVARQGTQPSSLFKVFSKFRLNRNT